MLAARPPLVSTAERHPALPASPRRCRGASPGPGSSPHRPRHPTCRPGTAAARPRRQRPPGRRRWPRSPKPQLLVGAVPRVRRSQGTLRGPAGKCGVGWGGARCKGEGTREGSGGPRGRWGWGGPRGASRQASRCRRMGGRGCGWGRGWRWRDVARTGRAGSVCWPDAQGPASSYNRQPGRGRPRPTGPHVARGPSTGHCFRKGAASRLPLMQVWHDNSCPPPLSPPCPPPNTQTRTTCTALARPRASPLLSVPCRAAPRRAARPHPFAGRPLLTKVHEGGYGQQVVAKHQGKEHGRRLVLGAVERVAPRDAACVQRGGRAGGAGRGEARGVGEAFGEDREGKRRGGRVQGCMCARMA